jgi:CheY-like chemotaxis protein
MVIAESLRDLGYVIHEAANGQEALAVWKQHHAQIDLLFSDMVMPGGITGRDLAEKFREDKPGLKVVLSSGYSAETIGQRFPSEGDTVLLQKPYRLHELSKTVRDCLDQR